MLKYASGISVASVAAAVFSAGAFGAVNVATPSSPVIVGKYEVRNADRGAVKRIKVFHDGARIATIVLRRGAASNYCCTNDACREVETPAACTTLRIACDADGWCSAH